MAKTTARDLGDAELITRIAEEKDRLFKLRFQLATGQLEDSSRLTLTKRDIARLLTELRAGGLAPGDTVTLPGDRTARLVDHFAESDKLFKTANFARYEIQVSYD